MTGVYSTGEEGSMSELTYRRSFLGRAFAAAAAGFMGAGAAQAQTEKKTAAAPAAGPDSWIQEVKGTHRCLFDFPQHRNGVPLLHILNYLNTYKEAYKSAPGTVGAVGTFYAVGSQSSIPLAFNDAMWAKYALGDYTGLKDSSGKGYTRNVLYKPTKDDAHLVVQAFQTPNMPEIADVIPAMGIASLQQMGTKFLLCNNAFGVWCLELQARGKGKADAIGKELMANLLPNVAVVPAMVIAIEKAQAAGIRYNRQ